MRKVLYTEYVKRALYTECMRRALYINCALSTKYAISCTALLNIAVCCTALLNMAVCYTALLNTAVCDSIQHRIVKYSSMPHLSQYYTLHIVVRQMLPNAAKMLVNFFLTSRDHLTFYFKWSKTNKDK